MGSEQLGVITSLDGQKADVIHARREQGGAEAGAGPSQSPHLLLGP